MSDNFVQSVDKTANVFKTSIKETPDLVKETLKKYSDYKISSDATFTRLNKNTVYKFKVKKGK